MNARSAGFTLVEILVALAIVAVALTAGMRALAQADRQRDRAQGAHARAVGRAESARRRPDRDALAGARQLHGEAAQAGSELRLAASVATTPNPAFRRIEITVAEPHAPDYVLARLTGFLGNRTPRP